MYEIHDALYGDIVLSEEEANLLNTWEVQRLRRIKQLGLTNLVYPGANHTRLQHALGAMHLMSLAIDVIRSKGHEITEDEAVQWEILQ